VESFFDELQKNPSKYRHRVARGRKVREVALTASEIRKHRRVFRQKVAKADLAKLIAGKVKKRCPEIEWCVRINRTPTIFNTCCYLCLSPAVIQCHGDFP